MPSISKFYGILIFMHLTWKEHNPPHIHAYYGDFEASFYIENGEIMYGKSPSFETELVKRFVLFYKEELLAMWETEIYRKLPPIE